MAIRMPTPDRLAAFSDGVLAIIITIMVLELELPRDPSPGSLLEQWPTFLSYAMSYLFVAIFWVTHHHLLHHTAHASADVIWANFFVLFFVSLIPFFTAYMAVSRLDSFTTALYAGIFLMVTVGLIILQGVIARQFVSDAHMMAMHRAGIKRSRIALVSYTVAIPGAYVHPAVTMAIILGIAVLYFVPDPLKTLRRVI